MTTKRTRIAVISSAAAIACATPPQPPLAGPPPPCQEPCIPREWLRRDEPPPEEPIPELSQEIPQTPECLNVSLTPGYEHYPDPQSAQVDLTQLRCDADTCTYSFRAQNLLPSPAQVVLRYQLRAEPASWGETIDTLVTPILAPNEVATLVSTAPREPATQLMTFYFTNKDNYFIPKIKKKPESEKTQPSPFAMQCIVPVIGHARSTLYDLSGVGFKVRPWFPQQCMHLDR